ncbi:MAG: hypothetical protein HQK65_07680 [Desulfamplus sp.]|nr:hypothetical protein [Desulfamplus sp.]
MSIIQDNLKAIDSEWTLFQIQWKKTCSVWNDITRSRFEKSFVSEYDKLMNRYLRCGEETANLLEKAFKELEL